MFPTSFSFATTAEEVATAFEAEIRGKNVLITGTSLNGIGFETARVIARHANLVTITGHNLDRLKAAEATLKKELPSANIRPLTVDLSSLAAVREAAAEFNTYPEPLHVLIHNAAAPIGDFKLTVDNLESQIATDHIAPFLLTKLLASKLLAAKTPRYTPRVVFVASSSHAWGNGPNFDTLGRPDADKYEPLDAYNQAKSANVLTAAELSRRAKGEINAYSLHPGTVYTNIAQHPETMPLFKQLGIIDASGAPAPGISWKTLPQGAATTVAAAFNPSLDDKAGAYLSDCVVADDQVGEASKDPGNAARLWALTEEIIGEPFVF